MSTVQQETDEVVLSSSEFTLLSEVLDAHDDNDAVAGDTLQLVASIPNIEDSEELVALLQSDTEFTEFFGTDPSQWGYGLEKLSDKSKKNSIKAFALVKLWRPISILFFNRRAITLAKKIHVLEKVGNTTDYTVSVAASLPTRKTTNEILTDLEGIFKVIDAIAKSPKTAEPATFAKALEKAGLSVGAHPYLTKSWETKGTRLLGSCIGLAVAGKVNSSIPATISKLVGKVVKLTPSSLSAVGLTVGFIVGGMIAKEVGVGSPPIVTRGWKSNALILEGLKRMLDILESLYRLEEHSGKLDKVDTSEMSDADAAKFNEINFLLNRTIPTIRAVVAELSSGFIQAVPISAKDITDTAKKMINAVHKLKKQ